MSDPTGIYLWKIAVGWRFKVVFQFAETVAMWRPTRSMALHAARQIAEELA